MRLLLYLFLGLAGAASLVWVFGPREPVGPPTPFDPAAIGSDIDSYLHRAERRVPGIVRGAQKHVLWANPLIKDRRPYAIVYVHGFSATLEEIRPVPDIVARELGANIYYARLTGHGQSGGALARATVPDWRRDLAEAIEIGQRIGDQVILMGTSTGGTLITLALDDPALREAVAGVVFVAPNFRVKAEGSSMLTWPFARQFVPLIVGPQRVIPPENQEHEKWWTLSYPTEAVLPMAAAVKAANAVNVGEIDLPALFVFSDADEVVDARRTRQIAAAWGGAVSLWPVEAGRQDDRSNHVVAGDIMSPGLTDPVAERILEWVAERRL